MKGLIYSASGLIAILFLVLGLIALFQRRLLYFPTHYNTGDMTAQQRLTRWEVEGGYAGYARIMKDASRIWFFIHGNGGQASNRDYVLQRIGLRDSIYILEYPGYGERPGRPTKARIDAAARHAYLALIRQYGVDRIVVLGESLGSGPACELARTAIPPKHIVLVVPFDSLTAVAQEAYPFLPVSLLLLDQWDNCEALKNYAGRLDIFGAKHDQVIPVHHARNLADSCLGAHYYEFDGDHGWASGGQVDLTQL